MSDCLTDSDLHRYQAGELDEAEETRIRQHLAECEHCARRDAELVAEHKAMIKNLRGNVYVAAREANGSADEADEAASGRSPGAGVADTRSLPPAGRRKRAGPP